MIEVSNTIDRLGAELSATQSEQKEWSKRVEKILIFSAQFESTRLCLVSFIVRAHWIGLLALISISMLYEFSHILTSFTSCGLMSQQSQFALASMLSDTRKTTHRAKWVGRLFNMLPSSPFKLSPLCVSSQEFFFIQFWRERSPTRRTFHQIWSYRLEITIYNIYLMFSSSCLPSTSQFLLIFPSLLSRKTLYPNEISSNLIFHLVFFFVVFSIQFYNFIEGTSSNLIQIFFCVFSHYDPNPIDSMKLEVSWAGKSQICDVRIYARTAKRICAGLKKMMMMLSDDDTVDNEESFLLP